ncbi:MAG: hypothetical protein WBY44_12710, partial [Bryobacteraceae bacterium]
MGWKNNFSQRRKERKEKRRVGPGEGRGRFRDSIRAASIRRLGLHKEQLLTYLRLANKRLGLLI